jgi:hypothetical protein
LGGLGEAEELPETLSFRDRQTRNMRLDVMSCGWDASARVPGRIGLIEPVYVEHQFALENHLQIREEVFANSCPIDRVADQIELLQQPT